MVGDASPNVSVYATRVRPPKQPLQLIPGHLHSPRSNNRLGGYEWHFGTTRRPECGSAKVVPGGQSAPKRQCGAGEDKSKGRLVRYLPMMTLQGRVAGQTLHVQPSAEEARSSECRFRSTNERWPSGSPASRSAILLAAAA